MKHVKKFTTKTELDSYVDSANLTTSMVALTESDKNFHVISPDPYENGNDIELDPKYNIKRVVFEATLLIFSTIYNIYR